MSDKLKIRGLLSIYFFGFLLAFHVALTTFINSSFLDIYLAEKYIGVIYIVASILTILSFLFMPIILKKWGNYRIALSLISLKLFVLIGLIFFTSPIWLIVFFILNLISISLLYFSSDIFLEGYSSNQVTGKVRGIYLTAVNLAWVFSPIIAGWFLTDDNYRRIYLLSLLFLIPGLLILIINLRRFKDSPYQATEIGKTIKSIWQDKNLTNILLANVLLTFFYSWMTIYTPLYLHKDLGFSWGEIGLIFSFMLLPFVFVQFPLGRLADKKWGEKEMLIIGFVIIALATGSISFIHSHNIWIWIIILFTTRIGAATIEIMTETYFFKKVSGLNANIISFFRMASPLSYILGPLLATIMLSIFSLDLRYLFLILGLIMLLGIKFSLTIKDTK